VVKGVSGEWWGVGGEWWGVSGERWGEWLSKKLQNKEML